MLPALLLSEHDHSNQLSSAQDTIQFSTPGGATIEDSDDRDDAPEEDRLRADHRPDW